MNIPKAIEIGQDTLQVNYKYLDPDYREFIKLSIEALNFALDTEQEFEAWKKYHLPSKTTDKQEG